MVDLFPSKDAFQRAATDVLSILSHVYLDSLSPIIFNQLFFDIQDRFLAVERLNNRSTLTNLFQKQINDQNVLKLDTDTSVPLKKLSVDCASEYVELCIQSPSKCVGTNYCVSAFN